MIVAAVIMPHWLYGSWGADFRLPVALPFVLIASTRLDVQRAGIVSLLCVLALALLGVRVYALTLTWRDIATRFAEFRAASHIIAKGSRVLIVESGIGYSDQHVDGVPVALARLGYMQFTHMPKLAVMDRDAFIPYQFTDWTTIKPALRNAGLSESTGGPLTPTDLVEYAHDRSGTGEEWYAVDWSKKFDYLLWIDFGQPRDLLPEKLKLVASGSFFGIYRIER
jgi:hypothetical protein